MPPTPLFDQFEELHTALERLHRLARLYGTSVRLWSVCQTGGNDRIELERDDLATLFDTLADTAGHELARVQTLHRDVRTLTQGA